MSALHPSTPAIARVTLAVHALHDMTAFYRRVLGLSVVAREGDVVDLGAGGAAFLRLIGDPGAARWTRRMPGLFHVAFLLPGRADLGAWLRHAAASGTPLEGASDHGVSEAIYLADPEGNGIEVYADRDPATWPRGADGIAMHSLPLDLDGVASSAVGPWTAAPPTTRIGHVHLQAGDLGWTESLLEERLGMTLTQRLPRAAFFGWNGYHHDIAVNTWKSGGAAAPVGPVTGLREIALIGGEALDLPTGTHIASL